VTSSSHHGRPETAENPRGRDPGAHREPHARVLLWALRLGLGALFVVTGALKLGDPNAFAVEIHNYQLFPALAPLLAATLPVIEIVVGAALVAGPRPWLRAGALASAALMLVFTVAVASAVARGINISCGCFGAAWGSSPVTLITIARDVALLAASGAVLRLA
jgi:putative oxidoreductase